MTTQRWVADTKLRYDDVQVAWRDSTQIDKQTAMSSILMPRSYPVITSASRIDAGVCCEHF
jgi:hypothetical protein